MDPFRHHPNLRGKITPAEESFFRDFTTEKLRAMALEHGMPVDWWWSDAEREAHRARTLAGRFDRDLWIFGYGSLMWDPALEFAEVRRARVEGVCRAFILKEVNGGRGTEECPGLMAALDQGGACDGLVFRVPAEHVERETEIFWRREFIAPAYLGEFREVQTALGPVEALTLVADHSADDIDASLTRAEQVELFARAEGILGSSREYLENVASKLRELDIHDEAVESLLAEVQARAAP